MTWERLAEALEEIKEVELASKIRDDYGPPQSSKDDDMKVVRSNFLLG